MNEGSSSGGCSIKTKYFVSNYYVEKIVDNMKQDAKTNLDRIESFLEKLEEKMKAVDVINDEKLPTMN